MTRMQGIARAALAGRLDADRLKSLGPEITTQEMQHLKGIGPFYASLITIRAVGFADVPPVDEPIVRELVTRLYRLPEPCTPDRFLEIADAWRPFRTWASVLIRAAASSSVHRTVEDRGLNPPTVARAPCVPRDFLVTLGNLPGRSGMGRAIHRGPGAESTADSPEGPATPRASRITIIMSFPTPPIRTGRHAGDLRRPDGQHARPMATGAVREHRVDDFSR